MRRKQSAAVESLSFLICRRSFSPLPFFLPPFSSPKKQRFAAVIMRIRDPKTTALIFASGKMVSRMK